MKVKKGNLEVFFLVLRETDGILNLADARVRDAFMKPLGVEVDAMVADRIKIYEMYCKKKEDGTPDVNDGNFHFSKENSPIADKELIALYGEEVEVEFKWGVSPSKLKEIIEKSKYMPKYGEVEKIDEVLASLEVKEEKPKKEKK